MYILIKSTGGIPHHRNILSLLLHDDYSIGSIILSSGASAISEEDIFIYSCSAQLISFEIESKEINCAEHEYMNMSSSLIAISEEDIFIYSCSAQLISFEIESKEINCAEHEYMNMSSSLIALAPLLIILVYLVYYSS